MKSSWRTVILLFAILRNVLADCPIPGCICYKPNGHSLRVIYCQDRGFREIPEIVPTDELFSELVLSNNQEYRDGNCQTCNRITEIPPDTFNGLRVRKLDLRTNPVRRTYAHSFNGIQSDLHELLLEGDQRVSLPYHAISILKNLKKLELKNFNAKFLDSQNKFKAFPELDTLRLINLNLKFIRKASFRGRLQKLTTLEIHGNMDLGVLPVSALRKLPSLEILKYTNNGLETLPFAAFRRQANLRVLDLSNNNLRELEKGCFKTVKNSLEYLALHRNQLHESKLSPLANSRWKNLQHLNLTSNQISSLSGLFKNMKSLQTLMVVENEIQQISKSDFSNLGRLVILDLSYNDIKTIQPFSFQNCRNLAKLSIQGNKGTYGNLKLTSHSLAGIKESLRQFNIRQTTVAEGDLWMVIRDLTGLEQLDLSGTGITNIPKSIFQKFTNLQYLYLSNNRIKMVTSETMRGLENSLQRIELQNNLIRTLSECVFKVFTNIEVFNLHNNPLHCDCQMRWLRDWSTSESNLTSLVTALVKPMCQTPNNFKNMYLTNVPRENLICSSENSIEKCEKDSRTQGLAGDGVRSAIPPPSFGKYFQRIMGK